MSLQNEVSEAQLLLSDLRMAVMEGKDPTVLVPMFNQLDRMIGPEHTNPLTEAIAKARECPELGRIADAFEKLNVTIDKALDDLQLRR